MGVISVFHIEYSGDTALIYAELNQGEDGLIQKELVDLDGRTLIRFNNDGTETHYGYLENGLKDYTLEIQGSDTLEVRKEQYSDLKEDEHGNWITYRLGRPNQPNAFVIRKIVYRDE